MKNINKRHLRNDVIFIVVILLLALAGAAALFYFSGEGDMVEVTVDGKSYGVYSLSENITEDIHTENDGLNRLVIKNKEAYVESANCPDGICSAHKPVSRNGESIVCLPHKVVIAVIGKENADEADIVA